MKLHFYPGLFMKVHFYEGTFIKKLCSFKIKQMWQIIQVIKNILYEKVGGI